MTRQLIQLSPKMNCEASCDDDQCPVVEDSLCHSDGNAQPAKMNCEASSDDYQCPVVEDSLCHSDGNAQPAKMYCEASCDL